MAAAARDRGRQAVTPGNPIPLDGRGPHEGLLSVIAIVMIVVAVLFAIGVLSGSLLEVAPGSTDIPPPASEQSS